MYWRNWPLRWLPLKTSPSITSLTCCWRDARPPFVSAILAISAIRASVEEGDSISKSANTIFAPRQPQSLHSRSRTADQATSMVLSVILVSIGLPRPQPPPLESNRLWSLIGRQFAPLFSRYLPLGDSSCMQYVYFQLDRMESRTVLTL